jgi:hypothetical protein
MDNQNLMGIWVELEKSSGEIGDTLIVTESKKPTVYEIAQALRAAALLVEEARGDAKELRFHYANIGFDEDDEATMVKGEELGRFALN